MQGHGHLQHFIGGQWTPGRGTRVTQNINPANHTQVLGTVAVGTVEDVEDAVAAAKKAHKAWRATPAPKRGLVLLKARQLMEERANDIARALAMEEGKLFTEAKGELQRAINVLEFMAGEGRRFNGETVPSELPNTFVYTARAPVGVVGIVTPWNFPVAIPVWKLAPALLCGNGVVFKPASLTPWTATLICKVFEDAGLPPGVLNMVYGGGSTVGQRMVTHPDIVALSFTGSNEVGTRLYADAAPLLKKVQCEMGGKNPVIVLEDADIELAALGTVQGAFGSTGQRCTATSRVVVVESVADKLVERMLHHTRAIRVGDPLKDGVGMGPAVDEGQLKTDFEYVELGQKEGAKLLCGGDRPSDPELKNGYFITPAIFDHVKPNSRLAQEEVFGPVLSVQRVKDWEEAVEVANNVRFGLTSSIYTNNIARCLQYADQIETGMLHVNSPTVGGEAHLPFGGAKATGVGQREMGKTAIDFYSEWRTVYVDYTGQKRAGNLY
jgi:acyl-CoA reductase-like NAD-dependent aldehyde dehydrogenase